MNNIAIFYRKKFKFPKYTEVDIHVKIFVDLKNKLN